MGEIHFEMMKFEGKSLIQCLPAYLLRSLADMLSIGRWEFSWKIPKCDATTFVLEKRPPSFMCYARPSLDVMR